MDGYANLHLVRIGSMGQIGRFRSVDAILYRRNARVILRTSRGLEIGQVVTPPFHSSGDIPKNGQASDQADGVLLRQMTVEDELLTARLEKNRDEAFEACCELLVKHNVPGMLIDVELLFDGQGLYFYFLGEVSEDVECHLTDLAEKYNAVAKLSQFAETLAQGCGPDCGTGEADCGEGGCASCALASACSTQTH